MKHRTSKRPGGNDPIEAFRNRFTRIWCLISVSVIVLWTLWTLLDAFVIPRDIVTIETASQEGTVSSTEGEDSKGESGEEEFFRKLLEEILGRFSKEKVFRQEEIFGQKGEKR